MEFLAESQLRVEKLGVQKSACKYQVEDAKNRASQRAVLVICGLLIGGVNGLFGAGGGMLAVPILSFVLGLSESKAHATAILVILPLCFASTVVYLLSNSVDYVVLIPTVLGVIIGGIVGAKLLKVLPEIVLFCVFNFLVIVAGLKMIF